MDVLATIQDVAIWLTDPAHWTGPDGIPTRLWEHLTLSIAAVVVALIVALPIGLFIGHTRRGEVIAINLANIARAIPSYAVMVMALPLTLALDPRNGLTTYPILIAMILLAIVPILVNASAGVRDIDPELVEAARGHGPPRGRDPAPGRVAARVARHRRRGPDLGGPGRRDRHARARSSATAGSGGT